MNSYTSNFTTRIARFTLVSEGRAARTALPIAAIAAMLSMACTATSSAPGTGGPACVPAASLSPTAASVPMENRAYVASRDTGNITVIDLDKLEIMASLDTCSPGYHMLELSTDFKKGYASSNETGKLDVIDVASMTVTGEIQVGLEPTHLSMKPDGKYLAVVAENDNAVSFIDPDRDRVVKRLTGFFLPHFVRFAPDGQYAYVANLAAHHVTRIDVSTLSVDGQIPLDGFDGPPNETLTEDREGGFADVQIDQDGVLWGAHRETGQTLVYDTTTQKKLPQLFAGTKPWIVYAEHPFTEVAARAVPAWGNKSVTLFDRAAATADQVDTEENESYGVNYSSRVPAKAFVMNRRREEIAVVNTQTKKRDAIIAVGGTTETASTTADGRYIVAAVSSANKVVVIDAVSNDIVKTFDNVGSYPWTVTIPLGQNYCH
jgi:DNA-binding beta-propeller fold protein YncE